MKKGLLLLFLIVFSLQRGYSQQNSTKGTEFWLTFLQNYTGSLTSTIAQMKLTVHFSAEQNSVVTITNPNGSYTKTINVAANTMVSDTVLTPQCYNVGSGNIVNRGLKITATTDITMYAWSYISVSSDATVVLPTPALGLNYRIITYKGLNTTYPSEFGIVATRDSTNIKIVTTANTVDNKTKGVPYYITLHKGQSYQVQSKTDSTLTGSTVEVQNCKPIAVFGGSVCSNVPTGCSACDHLYEQLYPINTWGKEFIAVHTATRNKDRLVIVADQANTTLSINGSSSTITNAGGFYDADINTPTYITSNKPVAVGLFAEGQGCGGGSGDPMMMWVSPIEQNIKSIIFVAQSSALINSHYVNIIATTASCGSVKLNNVNIGSSFATVPSNTAYSYVKKSISSGTNTIVSDSGFTAYAYGYGNYESYGYNVGSSIRDLVRYFTINDVPNDNQSTVLSPMKVCKDFPISFKGVSGNYSPLYWLWKFDDDTVMTQNVTRTFTDTGLVKVMMFTPHLVNNNLCSASDTVVDTAIQYVKVVVPRISFLNTDTVICYGDSIAPRIEFNDDSTVVWKSDPDLSCVKCFSPIIKPSTSKWYKVSNGKTSMGCIVSDSFYVRVIDTVRRKLSNDTMICKGNSVTLNATILNPDTLVDYTYKWYVNNTLVKQDTTPVFTVKPDTTTFYTLKINNGCKDFTSTVKVAVRDTLKIQYTDSFQICRVKNNSFTFKATGGDSSYTIYLLQNNIVKDSILNAAANTNYSFSFAPDPASQYKLIMKDGCTTKNDTAIVHFTYRSALGFTHTADTLICRDQNAQLKVKAFGGDSTYTFYLLKNSTLVDSITNALINQNYFFNISTSSSATYKIILKDGCTTLNDTQSINVTVRNPLSFTVSNDSTVCEGNLTDIKVKAFGGDSTYTFYLMDGNTVKDTIKNAVINQVYQFYVRPTFLTNFKIILEDGCTGKNDTHAVVYTLRPPLGFTHSNDTMICYGQFLPIYFKPYGGDSSYNCYLLKNNVVVDSMTATFNSTHFFLVNPSSNTTYTIVLKDGCTYLNDTQSIQVRVRAPLSLTVSNTGMICRGQPLDMGVIPSGGDSTYNIYLLNNNIIIDSVKNATIGTLYLFTKVPALNASYKFVIKDGCSAPDASQNVNFVFRSALSFQHTPDTTICLGNSFNIQMKPAGGDSTYTLYLLRNNLPYDSIQNASIGNTYNFPVSPITNTTYKLVLKDLCTLVNDTQTINVSIRKPLSFTTSIDSFICEGSLTDIKLKASGGDSSYTFYLLDSTSIVDSIVNAVNGNIYQFWVHPKYITKYSIILTDGCTVKSDTQTITYTFRQPLGFTHTPDTTICTGQTAQLYFRPYGGDSTYNCYLLKNNIIVDSVMNATLLATHSFTVTPSATTNYAIIVSDECTYLNDTQTVRVTLRDPLSIQIVNDSVICRGQHILISATPNGGDSTYRLYLFNNGVLIDSVTNAISNTTYNWNLLPALTDNYSFVLKDDCTILNDSQKVTFGFRGPLTFTISPDTTICIGQNTNLRVSPYGGDSTYTLYLVQGSTIIDSITNAILGNVYNFNVAPNITTSYSVKITDGCTILTDTHAVTIFVRNALKLTETHDTLICKGQTSSISVKGAGGYNNYTFYLLQGGNKIDSINNAVSNLQYKFFVAPFVKTTYQIVLQDGCTKLNDNIFITIDVYPPLVVKATTSKPKICFGDSITLTATASGGNFNNPYTYSWNNGAGSNKTAKIYPQASAWYVIKTDDGCSSSALDSVYIDVEPNPIADFTAGNTSGCEPFTTTFTNNTTTFSNVKYLWRFGDGTSDTTANPPPHTYIKPGKYEVKLYVTSAFGCIDSISKPDYITVNPNPVINLKLNPKKIKVNNGKITFTAGFKFTDDFDFDFGDGTSVLNQPVSNNIFAHIYTDTGYFMVKLSARNNFGCTTNIDDTLFIEDYFTVFIPNAFSPNNLDGINDRFKPVTTFSKHYDMNIYDRWGQLIYTETCDDRWFNCKGWDGTYNGEPVQEDAYIYLITLHEEDNSNRYYHRGTVIVIR